MNMALYMEKEVRAGMDLLDTWMAGWEGHLDLDRLDIQRVDDCVVGQLFGSWYLGLSTLGVVGWDSRYGFSIPNKVLDGAPALEAYGRQIWANKQLTNTWRVLVRERLGSKQVKGEQIEVTAIDEATPVKDRELVLV